MKKQHIILSSADKVTLTELLSKGSLKARVYKRATALVELDRGKTIRSVADTLSVSYSTVQQWRKNYQQQGLSCLQDRPRAGRPVEIDGEQRARITALACSCPPEGYAKWSLRLLADRAVELGYCEHVSYRSVGKVLKKMSSSLT